jgi:hypothetical protein
MIAYIASLKLPKLILWCYLAWYVAIVVRYFDPMPSLWISSLGIAVIIGFALTLATQQKDHKADRWVLFRLYVFPFCVSSYSALIKGEGLFLLFPTEIKGLLSGVIACSVVVFVHWFCKFLLCGDSSVRFSGKERALE